MARYASPPRFFGVGLGTDTGGFSLAARARAPTPQATRCATRSRPTTGSVTFARERTGDAHFDLNRDGVAHYGLFADLLADMQRTSVGRRALPLLFSSAQAYLDTWQRAFDHR